MSSFFTKEEAVLFLGEIFIFIIDYPADDSRYQDGVIKAGEVGKVTSIDSYYGEIKLTLDVYGNYYGMDKSCFLNHCQILKPVIVDHSPSA